MKKWFQDQIRKLELRKAALAKKSAESTDITEVRSINLDLETINTDISEFRKQIEEIEVEERKNEGNGDPLIDDENPGEQGEPEKRNTGQNMVIGSFGGGTDPEARKALAKVMETRGAGLKAKKEVTMTFTESAEERAITVASDTLVVPTHYSNTLKEKFNEISGTMAMTDMISLPGGEAYVKGFEISDGTGDYTAEGADATDAEPTFGKVSVGKAKITAYAEITDEVAKLPNVQYQAIVGKSVRKAVIKKINQQIIVGAGTAETITGIFNAPVAIIPLASDIEVSAIDADTLDDIVFSYGGDESIEGNATLILSKADLGAFNAVKQGNGDKYYEIKLDPSGNSGTISSKRSFAVPFVINSICPVLSAAATVADTYCMAYGKMQAYEMPIFSKMVVKMSEDYKFKSGDIAFKATIYIGGNTVMYKGFVKIKKVAAV